MCDVTWVEVRAGRDYLEPHTKRNVVDAVTELVWNGLDAEADLVDVDVHTGVMGSGADEMRYVTSVTVSDNGHGMTHDRALEAFSSLGDSWKKFLHKRTVNGKRALHGSNGRGRFAVYSIGHSARWETVAQDESGRRYRVVIRGDRARINGCDVDAPEQTKEPNGTHVIVTVSQGESPPALLADDLASRLTSRLAPHLMANRDIVVRLNGQRLDPHALVDGEPKSVELENIPADELAEREIPTLHIYDWTEDVRQKSTIMLCDEHGNGLIEVDRAVGNAAVGSTGYLNWSGFGTSGQELALAPMRYPDLISAAVSEFDKHVQARLKSVRTTIVQRLKREGAYPYGDSPSTDPIKQVEQEMFDLVVVAARGALSKGTKQSRTMSAKLMQLALQERPDSLDTILAEVFDMPDDGREQFADMLRYSTLGKIVGASAEVTRRLDLISTLRHVIYGAGVAEHMREVDQLHPLVRDNAWLFGEEWALSSSEKSLTTVLRSVVGKDKILDTELGPKGTVLRSDGKTGRVDLLLQRTVSSPGHRDRLIVELKRPSKKLGREELNQVNDYAAALSKHDGTGKAHWTFWLVGAHISEKIEDELDQSDRTPGHYKKQRNYDIWVVTWGDLLTNAEQRLAFFRDQLQYDVSQEEAVQRVHDRHAELLPPQLVAPDSAAAS